MNKQIYKRTIVESCYDHVGGILGEAIFKLVSKKDEKSFELTDTGVSGLESLGVEIKKFV